MKARPLGPDDVDGLCVLVDRDRLPGQPPCTPDRVRTALAGRSTTDPWWWRELATMRTVGVEGPDGSLVDVGFFSKGAARSQVAIGHRKLTSQSDAARMKVLWSEKLEALAELLGARSVERR